MANQNEFAGVFPKVIHPVNDGETTVSQYIEKREGEVALDSYVRAQTSAPEVVKRITELETSLQGLASAAMNLLNNNNGKEKRESNHAELRVAVEEAKLVLKNRLEIDEAKHRFHSELGSITDDPLGLRRP
jgi:hypothetical protein